MNWLDELKLRCQSRLDLGLQDAEMTDAVNKGLIREAVACSEKVLLHVTSENTKDRWFGVEVAAAVDKAVRFGRDTLFVLTDPQVSEDTLNDLGLHEFQKTVWSSTVDDAKLPDPLASWVIRDVELGPIPQMPGQISGYYVAFVYYCEYLKLVLENHRAKFVERMSQDTGPGVQVVQPMLIIVPESCRAPDSFDVEGKIVTERDKYVVNVCDYSGKKNHDLKVCIVELIVDAEKIYFTADFPACLSTLRETFESGLTGLTENQLAELRIDFCATLQSLLCHPNARHCVDQYRLLLWPDRSVELYDFLLPVLRSVAEEAGASSLVYDPRESESVLAESSSRRVSRCSLSSLYGSRDPYAMSTGVRCRGVCLIMDISGVICSKDIDQLSDLFSRLFQFKVNLVNDQLTHDRLEQVH